MADKKISELSSATTPLSGIEVIPLVQTNETRKVTVNDLVASLVITISWGEIQGSSVYDQGDLGIILNEKYDKTGGNITGPMISSSTIVASSFNGLVPVISGPGTNALFDDGVYKAIPSPIDGLQDGQVVVADGDDDVKTTGTTVFNVSNAIITTQHLAQEKTLKVSASRNWTHIDVAGNPSFSCAIYNQESFIAAGNNTTNVYRSVDDGLTWATVATGVNETWSGATYNSETNTTVLAGTNASIITSENGGLTWAQQTTPIIVPTPNWQDVTYANGRYISVGGTGTVGSILWSNDKITWNIATHPAVEVLDSVAFGNDVWVAVGGNTGSALLVSFDNGENWTTQTITSGSIQSITFGQDIFLLADTVGDLYTSRNGLSGTWVQVGNFGGGDTGATYYALGQFIVAGGGSAIRTSWDALNWTLQVTSPATANLTYIAASDKSFIATSSSPFQDIYRSTTPVTSINDMFESDGESDFSVIPTIGLASARAVANAQDASAAPTITVINTVNVPEEITGRIVLASSLNNLFNVTNDGAPATKPMLTYVGFNPGIFLLNGSAAIDNVGGASVGGAMGFFLNGIPLLDSYIANMNIIEHMSISRSIIELNTNDEVTFGVINETNIGDMNVSTLSVTIVQIG